MGATSLARMPGFAWRGALPEPVKLLVKAIELRVPILPLSLADFPYLTFSDSLVAPIPIVSALCVKEETP